MATTTYEEERKRPELIRRQTYAPPTNTATQQAQADIDAFYNDARQRFAAAADPVRQAEEDARIQRGRQFWTGANLFANVIANAINANGTARNAPNMTWNNEMEKNMYATWRDVDKQLRADRKEAQQRYDAIGMQQNQLRLEAAKAKDAAEQKAYDINFNNANADIADQNKLAQDDFVYERKKADEEAARQKAQQDKIDFYEYQRRHPMPSRSGGSRGGGSRNSVDHSVSVGSVDIPAKDKKEAEKIRKNVADKIVDKLNKDIEERNKSKKVTEEKEKPISKPKSDKEAQEILYQYGGLYDDDADFRDGINSTYGIEDIYAEEAVPEFEQFGGHSVRPDESSMPEPRRYAGTTPNQTPRAYRGNPVTWNTSPIRQTPHALSEGEKELLKKGGKKPKIEY